MHLYRRQTAQCFHNRLVGDLQGFIDGLALYHFGGLAGRCDRRAAAKGLEFYIHDHIIFHLDVDAHNIAALGVAHGAYAAGVFHFAHIAGVGEMIHYLLGIFHNHAPFKQSMFPICACAPDYLF